MNDNKLDFLETQASKPIVTDDSVLKRLSDLAQEMNELDSMVESAELHLKELKDRREYISSKEIPELAMLNGVKSFSVEGIGDLKVESIYRGSVSQENWDDFKVFLESTGREYLIKEDGRITSIDAPTAKFLHENGINFFISPALHWRTISSIVKDLYEHGEEIPSSMKAFAGYTTKVKK